MATQGRVLVTGATGTVGRQVVSQLLSAGVGGVRAVTRTPDTARLPRGAEVRQGDLTSPGTLTAALHDVAAVFLMWPFHSAEPAAAVVAEIARQARRVVFLSSGAVQDGVAPERQPHPVGRSHRAVEQQIERSGLRWTHLRPSTFAANSLWWADQLRAGDVVRGAYGAVPMTPVHESDLAAVAVQALTEDGHEGVAYPLTGPAVLTPAEQVRVIGEVLGRPTRWKELSREAARQHLLAEDGFPDAFVDALLDGHAEMLAAPRPAPTSTIERVTGTRARTYRGWVADHAAAFG
ncbi:SDR family oxidoreductase [Streptomyces sp. NPDC001219]